MSRDRQSLEDIVRMHGISFSEFVVLNQVALRVPLRSDSFARFCVKEWEHRDEVNFSATDYVNAIDSCISRGWLRILTVEDLQDITDAGTSSSFPNLSYEGYREGSVDFMPQGFRLIRRIYDEIGVARAQQ